MIKKTIFAGFGVLDSVILQSQPIGNTLCKFAIIFYDEYFRHGTSSNWTSISCRLK